MIEEVLMLLQATSAQQYKILLQRHAVYHLSYSYRNVFPDFAKLLLL